jgi:hypothetical protein
MRLHLHLVPSCGSIGPAGPVPGLKGADVDGKGPAGLHVRLDLHALSSCVGWIILNTPGAPGGPAREDA